MSLLLFACKTQTYWTVAVFSAKKTPSSDYGLFPKKEAKVNTFLSEELAGRTYSEVLTAKLLHTTSTRHLVVKIEKIAEMSQVRFKPYYLVTVNGLRFWYLV